MNPSEPLQAKDSEAEPLPEIEDPELPWVQIAHAARDPEQTVPDLDPDALPEGGAGELSDSWVLLSSTASTGQPQEPTTMSREPAPEGAGEENDDDFDAGVGVGDGDDEAGDGEEEDAPEAGGEGNEDGSTLYSEEYEDPISAVIGGGDETGA